MMFRQYLAKFRINRRLSSFLLAGLFLLSMGIAPVRSQESIAIQFDRVEFQKMYQAGRYYKACESLFSNLKVDPKLCNPEITIDENHIKVIQNIIQNQVASEQKSIAYAAIGDVMNAIGKLETAKVFFMKGLLLKEFLSPEAEAAIHLNLGNTFRALGNLNRDRLAPSKYNYIPWKYEPKFMSEENLENYQKINNLYILASNEYTNAISTLIKREKIKDLAFLKKVELKAQLNSLSLDLEREKSVNIPDLNFSALSNNKDRVYARINFARSLAYQLQKSGQPIDQALPLLR
jgi:hypothetical protein